MTQFKKGDDPVNTELPPLDLSPYLKQSEQAEKVAEYIKSCSGKYDALAVENNVKLQIMKSVQATVEQIESLVGPVIGQLGTSLANLKLPEIKIPELPQIDIGGMFNQVGGMLDGIKGLTGLFGNLPKIG